MSTRCQIEFYDEIDKGEYGDPAARIYQHGDGYPSEVLQRLVKLAATLGRPSRFGPRLNDPEFAAAEYVTMYRTPMGGGIYISQAIHGDIEFLYRVVCTSRGLSIKVFQPKVVGSLLTFEESKTERGILA